jgi:hypothetical protein
MEIISMVFLLDLAFAAELIALSLGVAHVVWSYRNSGAGVGIARLFGYIIVISAIGGMTCTSYYGVSYWLQGYFKSPTEPTLMVHN